VAYYVLLLSLCEKCTSFSRPWSSVVQLCAPTL